MSLVRLVSPVSDSPRESGKSGSKVDAMTIVQAVMIIPIAIRRDVFAEKFKSGKTAAINHSPKPLVIPSMCAIRHAS